MPKTKEKIPAITSVDEFKSVVDGIANQTRERDQIALKQERAIAKIRAEFAEKLTPIDKAIAAQFKRASKFAVLKRAELFPKDIKSSCTALAEFGFSFGKPTLALSGDFTWDDVKDAIRLKLVEIHSQAIQAMKRHENEKAVELTKEAEKWESLLVTTTELVKENVKKLLTDKERALIGTEIQQKESFWVDDKKEKEAKLVEQTA
jgi:hypothetical protein